MATDEGRDFDPEAPEEREIGREMVDKSVGLGSVAAHFYRGEMSRVTMWRQRLDETTNWAVTIIAAILVYAFSTEGRDEIILAGIVVITVFVGIEARRYQDYDVFRARARMLQQNLFANALDPSQGVEHRAWRRELSNDYRNPTTKVPFTEALAHRLRRVYLPLITLLIASWLFKVTALSTGSWESTAAIGTVSGIGVGVVVGLYYIAVVLITVWPRERQAKGEFGDREYGEWKESE
ncbi:DUF2270 domain-containing protein [Halocatena pleomorpha]|uniref:DUF2270 domain-containing protein n=1 Tax=Halocatena pleomorpha TaxID=1785090 RepID=A0A3P3RJ52_9EURY|nr:DUF2270 domain-containing protein [Halocatena pleomorpha]RRJ33556.1 DUF2270 domain-containing protein [Halocatena pleomorpha]